jgi:hypothetical protein
VSVSVTLAIPLRSVVVTLPGEKAAVVLAGPPVVSGTGSGSLNTATVQFVAPVYTVTVATDPASGNGTPTNCVDPNIGASGNTNCSLRDAVAAANALIGVTTNINFATPLFSTAQTILIAQSTPITINASMNIKGPGANLLTIEGSTTPLGSNVRVFQQTGGTVTLSGVTVANGRTTGNGGGFFQTGGTLTVSNSIFSGDQASSGGLVGNGGAIYATSTLTVSNSIFSGDMTFGNGNGAGSGIYAAQSGGTFGNLLNDSANSDSFVNVLSTALISGAANLSALGSYGGPTQTLLPLPGSAAICAGTQPMLNSTPLAADQRGVTISPARYGQTACYDIGAVQTEYAMTGPLTVPSLVALSSAVSPAPTVSLTENGTALTAGTATVTLSDTDNDLSSGASSTNSFTTGVVTFGNVQFASAETTDQLTATLSLNPATPVSLTVTSNSFQVGQLTPVFAFMPSPGSQIYGTAIAAGSLDATASYGGNTVAGSFSYTATSTTTNHTTALTAGSTILPADTYTLTATFTPTNTALYKSGLTVTAPYTVTQASQTISFTTAPPASATYNTQFTVGATGGGSGIALGYASSGGCSNVGATYTMTSGTTACTVTISQGGNTNYAAAINSVTTVNTNLASATLSFGAIPQHTYGDVPFNLGPSLSAGAGPTQMVTSASL